MRTLLRRSFLKGLALLPAAFRLKDRFGGCPDVRFNGTGFFRLEKKDRWWLVTPEGNAFLSFGLNHVTPGLLRRPQCIDHWAKTFGVRDASDVRQFAAGYAHKVREDLAALGMNTLGVHSSLRDLPPGSVPYVHTARFVDICHYMTPSESDFLDVFAPAFESHCDRVSQSEVLPRKDDAWLIGYFMTDCPIFTDQDAASRHNSVYGAVRKGLPTWPRVLRNLEGSCPGKRAYTATMRELYGGDITRFNVVYGTAFSSFEALEHALNWRPQTDANNALETRDNLFFLERVVERYYAVAVASIRRYDPNHLVLGDKLNGNTDTPDSIVRLAGRHADLVFYQMYGFWEEQKPKLDAWSRLTGKPLFNGDSSYAVPYDQMPDPYGPHCASQQDRARRFLEFGENAFARSDFVGWTWCGWIDGLKAQQQEKQHSGVQDPWGNYYRPLTQAMAGFSNRLYDLARR
jgi:hypothetical protein